MSKFQNGKIYKVTDTLSRECYIGSTISSLKNRLACHRDHYKNYINRTYHYISIFDLFLKYGVENCKIELIEDYPCVDKKELQLREGYHIRNHACLNHNIAGRTKKEYYLDNKDTIQRQTKHYYRTHREGLLEKSKVYREVNKDKIKERQCQAFQCQCGGHYIYSHTSRHKKSKKHLDFLDKNNF